MAKNRQVAKLNSNLPANTDYNPQSIIQTAIAKGADLVQLEKILELQERFEANEARKSYYDAMASFKAEPIEIGKDRHVFYNTSKGDIDYHHASLANVTNTISAGLSKHGLSATWKTSQDGKVISVTCTIAHRSGYSESTTLAADPDATGGKNSIQAVGSTITYLQRYTILAMTGLATKDQDDDGAGSEVESITEDQENELLLMLHESKLDMNEKYMAQMMAYLKVEALSQLPVKQFNVAKVAINQAIKNLGEKK